MALVRRRAHRLLLAGTVLAAGILILSLTTSAGARRSNLVSAAGQTYTDGVGDANGGPDVVKVVVSDDPDGTLHWTVSYASSGCISGSHSMAIGIDSDLNTDTGLSGIDYLITVGSSGISLQRWNSDASDFEVVASSTLKGSCGASGDEVRINRADVSVGSQMNFLVLTDSGAADEAPDTGFYSYTLSAGGGSPPPPPPPPPPGTPPPPSGALNASFGADAPPHYAHWRVRFDAVTFGAASYRWQFGDGSSMQTTRPLAYHRYATAGTFDATLVITDGTGAQAQSTVQVQVMPLPADKLPTIAGPSTRSRRDPAYSRVASKLSGAGRSVLCWSRVDWAILAKAFDENGFGGYVDPSRPHQIDLAPQICSRLDLLEYHRPRAAPTTSVAAAVLVLAAGVEEARGYVNHAQIACYALQTVPATSSQLGAGAAAAGRLGKLAARWFTRRNLPPGYWSPQCHDGGKLDLDPSARHWP